MSLRKASITVWGLWSVLLLVATMWSYSRLSFVSTSERATGEIVATKRRFVGGTEAYVARPTIKFRTPDGIWHSREFRYESASFDVPVGSKVEILYDKRQPDQFRVDWFWDLWLGPFVLAGIWGWCTLMCVTLLALQKREATKNIEIRPET